MGDNSVKNSQIKLLKPYAHLPIIGRKSTKFQVNQMKDLGGVAEIRSLGWTAGRSDGITHTRTDKGHFYSPLCLRRATKTGKSSPSEYNLVWLKVLSV